MIIAAIAEKQQEEENADYTAENDRAQSFALRKAKT